MYYPNTPAWRAMGTFYADRNGRGIPVNQQMMLLNGFQKAVECYEVLGINPEKKEEYMKVIQNSIDWQHETLETRRITVNGVSQESPVVLPYGRQHCRRLRTCCIHNANLL